MKLFKISFNFEADDDWKARDVEEMMNTLLDPISHLGDSTKSDLYVEEIEVEKWKLEDCMN